MAAEAKDQEVWTTSAADAELWGEPSTPPGGGEGGAAYYYLLMMETLNNVS